MKNHLKTLLNICELLFFLIFILPLRFLPFTYASDFGGWLTRTIGPKLKVNHIALKNLQHAFPDREASFYQGIISGMWDNLGRTILEYLRLSQQDILNDTSRFNIKGRHHVQHLIDDNKPGFILTIHQANWELGTLAATQMGLKGAQVTRFLNNPYLRWIINKLHGQVAQEIIPKSTQGARRIIEVLRSGGHVSMMMDQKLNEGINVPFFGKSVKTATAMIKLAQKLQCPILPVQVVRCNKTQFDIIYHNPIIIPLEASIQDSLYQIHQLFEQWIIAAPAQWFWVHRRFDKAFYKNEGA